MTNNLAREYFKRSTPHRETFELKHSVFSGELKILHEQETTARNNIRDVLYPFPVHVESSILLRKPLKASDLVVRSFHDAELIVERFFGKGCWS
jgi:hypothetical protein